MRFNFYGPDGHFAFSTELDEVRVTEDFYVLTTDKETVGMVPRSWGYSEVEEANRIGFAAQQREYVGGGHIMPIGLGESKL